MSPCLRGSYGVELDEQTGSRQEAEIRCYTCVKSRESCESAVVGFAEIEVENIDSYCLLPDTPCTDYVYALSYCPTNDLHRRKSFQ